MQFLLRHWHCIVPAAAFIVVILVMSLDKPDKKGRR